MANPRRLGTYETNNIGGEAVRAFIPPPLPPDPPLEITPPLQDLIEKANRGLGRLDGIARVLPDPSLFIYTYVRKEALLSSQIEGTQSSFSDLLLFEAEEAPGVPINDVEEVSHYVAAMNHAMDRLRGGFPISLRLICETHQILLSGARGGNKQPGEFRTSQNWIGGSRPGNARFVPPPPNRVMECLDLLEKFLHDDPVKTPLLIKAALSHVQFETIHPFLDGNGRIGRLLITLLLCAEEALSAPMLYLSLYFKTNRDAYYDLLQRVRTEGNWEAWLDFFLRGVVETTEQAAATAKKTMALFTTDRARIEALGRPAGSVLRVYDILQKRVAISIPRTSEQLGISQPTVTSAIGHLVKLRIAREATGRKRKKLYVYDAYLAMLGEGAEPLAVH
jgi:Fic family protein